MTKSIQGNNLADTQTVQNLAVNRMLPKISEIEHGINTVLGILI